MLGQDNFWRKMRQQVNCLWLFVNKHVFLDDKRPIFFFGAFRSLIVSNLFFFLCMPLQIYKENKPFYYINTYDETKSNWMRYVSAPYSPQSQNLIACQCGVSENFTV